MNIAQEIRLVANSIGVERPDVATRLLGIAVRVERFELLLDDISADAQQTERLRHHALAANHARVIEFPLRRPRPRLVTI